MDFISNRETQIQEMLKTIGVSSIEDLFRQIPEKLRRLAPQEDDGLSEMEGLKLMETLAAKNSFSGRENYLGAGAYEHHVPALIGAICGKSEFLTAYTPYQAEASQGMLQIIFEFQSAICALTGLDAANASLYDGASACAEALLMSMRLHKNRNKVLIAGSLHPHYREVVEQYLNTHPIELVTIPFLNDGSLDREYLYKALNENIAAVLIQNPNFFGRVEDLSEISAKIHQVGALSIISANPLTYALFKSAAEMGADIAVGDCQPLGLPLQFGGPYVGYICCKNEFIRQLPGRIVGETVDTEGRRGFVLTLQAREQHIRREKATSNICTNQALAALATLIGMLWYGKNGLPKLALTNYRRAAYLQAKLKELGPEIKILGNEAFLNEFAVNFGRPIEEVLHRFREEEIEPGLDLGSYFPELQGYLLVAVTETKSQAQLDRYVEIAKALRG